MLRYSRFPLIIALAAAATTCGDDVTVTARQVSEFISGVRSADGSAQGALVEGAAPDPSGGPTATLLLGSATVQLGGDAGLEISASDGDFAQIVIVIDGAEDYFQLNLGTPSSTATIVVSFDESTPVNVFDCLIAVIDSAGNIGEYVRLTVTTQEEPVDNGMNFAGRWFRCAFVEGEPGALTSSDSCQMLRDEGLDLAASDASVAFLDLIDEDEQDCTVGEELEPIACFPRDADVTFLRSVEGTWSQTGDQVTVSTVGCAITLEVVPAGDFFYQATPVGTSGECAGALEFFGEVGTLISMHTGEATFTTDEPEPEPMPAETYEPCNLNDGCTSPDDRCLGITGMEGRGGFCSPLCVEGMCAALEGDGVTGDPTCGLGEDGSTTPTRCIIVCSVEDPGSCPPDLECVNIPEAGGAVCLPPLP